MRLLPGNSFALIDYVDVAFTINSSAVFELLETDIPMYLLGESIFNQTGIAKKCELMEVASCLSQRHWQQEPKRQHQHLDSKFSRLGSREVWTHCEVLATRGKHLN